MSRMKRWGIGWPLVLKYYRYRTAQRLASLGNSMTGLFRRRENRGSIAHHSGVAKS